VGAALRGRRDRRDAGRSIIANYGEESEEYYP